MKSAENYVRQIMVDVRDEIVSETPTVYDHLRVERVYEFADGAVVKYEWQDAALRQFNHRFTLMTLPQPNTAKLKKGIIEIIDY